MPLFPAGGWASPRDWLLPTVALALAPMGTIARFTRASMLEVIRADYTLTARAKGLGEVPVIFKHTLKNAFIPVVTLLGPMFAAVGTGSFFVESIFRVPGMGRFFVLSMTGRDYPMIMAGGVTHRALLPVLKPRRGLPFCGPRPPLPVLGWARPPPRPPFPPPHPGSAGQALAGRAPPAP